ncbi:MAG: hypothetical protein K2K91_04305 [Ruminococcus sp.]|nr:hypothetical protein [Ruminococcus sp.]
MNLHEIYMASQFAGKNSGGNADLSDYYTKSQTDDLISEKVDKNSIVTLSQSEYDALSTKAPDTIYMIAEEGD